MTIPRSLPRFAEAFKIIIDHPLNRHTRILTGEWQMAATWSRASCDFIPLLAKAGTVGVIASTAPRHLSNFSRKDYYCDAGYPEVFWHPDGEGGFKLATSDEFIVEYCRRRRVSRELFDKPL